MFSSLKKVFSHYKKKISWFQFKKKLKKEKSKLYINNSYKHTSYFSKRNRFKFLKNKLEFENAFSEMKHIHIYYYIFWTFLFLWSLYVLFLSHYFSIKNIDIIRQDDLVNIDLSYKSIDFIRYESIFTQNKIEIQQKLFEYQPHLKDVYVRKIFPDNMKIQISSFPGLLTFEKDEKKYIITSNGVVIPSIHTNQYKKIHLKTKENLWIMDYKKIFSEDFIQKISYLITTIQENNSFVTIKEIHYYKKEIEIHIIDNNGTVIIFDLSKDINIQIQKMNIFFKEYRNKIKLWILYIDLRINEKIFYCSTENEFQCRVNLKNIYD